MRVSTVFVQVRVLVHKHTIMSWHLQYRSRFAIFFLDSVPTTLKLLQAWEHGVSSENTMLLIVAKVT